MNLLRIYFIRISVETIYLWLFEALETSDTETASFRRLALSSKKRIGFLSMHKSCSWRTYTDEPSFLGPGLSIVFGQYDITLLDARRPAELQEQINQTKLAQKLDGQNLKHQTKFYSSLPCPRMKIFRSRICAHLRGGEEHDWKKPQVHSVDSPMRITLRGFAPVCDIRTMKEDIPDAVGGKRFLPRVPRATMEITSGNRSYVGHVWDDEDEVDQVHGTIMDGDQIGRKSNRSNVLSRHKNNKENERKPGGCYVGAGGERILEGQATEPPWFQQEEVSSDTCSDKVEQDLELRFGPPLTSSLKPPTSSLYGGAGRRVQGRKARDTNPFLCPSSDADSGAASGSGAYESAGDDAAGGEGQAGEEQAAEANDAINELLKKERLCFLTRGASGAGAWSPGPSAGGTSPWDEVQRQLDAELWLAARAGSSRSRRPGCRLPASKSRLPKPRWCATFSGRCTRCGM